MNTPKSLNDAVEKDFILSPAFKNEMDHYFLRYWETGYFLSKFEGHAMELGYGNDVYIVKLISPTTTIAMSKEVRLSFRKPKSWTGIPPHVLVKAVVT